MNNKYIERICGGTFSFSEKEKQNIRDYLQNSKTNNVDENELTPAGIKFLFSEVQGLGWSVCIIEDKNVIDITDYSMW